MTRIAISPRLAMRSFLNITVAYTGLAEADNTLLPGIRDVSKANRAEDLLGQRGVVSIQVLNEFASVARRKFVLSMDQIRDVLSAVREVCTLAVTDRAAQERGPDIAE